MKRKNSFSRKGVFNFLKGIVGLALLALFAFALNALFAGASQTVSQLQIPSPQVLSSTPTIPTSQTEPTARWKVYVNEKAGYAIRYPSGWYLNKNSSIITSYDPEQAPGRARIPPSELKVWIVAVENPNRLPIKTWVEETLSKDKGLTTATQQREVRVGGVNGIFLKGYRTGDPKQTITSVYLAHTDKVYKIHAYPVDSGYFNIFLEMLNTFRFLEQ